MESLTILILLLLFFGNAIVSGGLKVLNFGGIKIPTSTAFGFKVNSCVDAEIGGVSHVKRTTRTGIEHQRDRQKDWLQPKDGS